MDLRYFIPAPQDKYGNTGIEPCIISAIVHKDKDPKYTDIWIFDKLEVVEPQEIKEKWPNFSRKFFIEVFDVQSGFITREELMKLAIDFKDQPYK